MDSVTAAFPDRKLHVRLVQPGCFGHFPTVCPSCQHPEYIHHSRNKPVDERLVVKLDVEGVEIDAMIGGARLLQTDCVVICEEHGHDPLHKVSKHILNQTELRLFCYDPDAGRYIRLKDVSPLDRIKKAVNRGYNVIATSSPFWEARILASST